MVRSRFAVLVVLATFFAAAPPARAQGDPGVEEILGAATSPLDLRARLVAYADERRGGDAAAAGAAWHHVGWSHWRGSEPDSAIRAWRRALELRAAPQDRYDLADGLLERRAPGDIDEATGLIERGMAEARLESPRAAAQFRALLAWAKLLAGESGEARTLFATAEPELSLRPLWRYRMSRASLSGPDPRESIVLLRPLAVASRARDTEVMRMLETAAQRIGQVDAMVRDVSEKIAARDRIEDLVVERMKGRRIKFSGYDGFPLSGVLLESKRPGRHRTAIVVLAPEDTLADFDSLGVALRESGLHTLLLQPRGSGWSAAPECPLPAAWRGREEVLFALTALDVREAVRAVRLAARDADTSVVVVAASRSLALAGVLAAEQDRRVRALVLLSPDPDPVDRGTLLARMALRPLPLFLQRNPEDFPSYAFMENVYQASDRPLSRVSEARVAGHGATAFRYDTAVTPRFVAWLQSALAPGKKATPPSPPRKG